jgi:hypothetical protein
VKFVPISAPLSATASRSFQNAKACGNRGNALFAAAYRHWKRERGFLDPGNLCPTCAAINERDFDED